MTSEQENPWKILSSADVYETPWFKVRKDVVINPAGNETFYTSVRFQNYALGIVPIDKEGNTWLVGQYRYPLEEYSWEIPMGGGPLQDDILDSAKRELKEETGIEAKKWTAFQRLHTSNSVTDEVGFVYLAEELTFGEAAPEESEDLQVKKLPFREVYQMVLDNEITDAISVAAILRLPAILMEKGYSI